MGLLLTGAGARAATICDGNCPSIELDGVAYDFVLALLAEPGQDLALTATGDVYIRGPIGAIGAVTLDASEAVIVGGGIEIDAGGGGGSGDTGSVIIIAPSRPLQLTQGPDGALSTLVDVDGDLYLDAAGVGLASLSVVSASRITVGLSAIPEPNTGLLLTLGFALLARSRRG